MPLDPVDALASIVETGAANRAALQAAAGIGDDACLFGAGAGGGGAGGTCVVGGKIGRSEPGQVEDPIRAAGVIEAISGETGLRGRVVAGGARAQRREEARLRRSIDQPSLRPRRISPTIHS